MTDRERNDALRNLIELGSSLDEALARLAPFPWPGEEPVVLMTTVDLRRVLDRFEAREVSDSDLERWAEEVHGREDIEFGPADGQLLADALFELSTPELFGSMPEIVRTIRTRLT